MDRLSRTHDVEPVLIERLSWSECLRRKATCDIFYDQPVLGYGSNAIEAWAMGIPVLAGVEDPSVRDRMLKTWGELPFFETTEAMLEADLRRLIDDADLRRTYAKLGYRHVIRWHKYQAVSHRLRPILERAAATMPGQGSKRLDSGFYLHRLTETA